MSKSRRLDTNDPTSEGRPGPTPSGGVRSTVYYRDSRGHLTPKSKATDVEIVEFDARGNQVARTYGTFNRG
jgi:hypothetical protein